MNVETDRERLQELLATLPGDRLPWLTLGDGLVDTWAESHRSVHT